MPNALAGETSPYLLQHADNPVDWRPWGTDALAAAAERDQPLLVSIGYSACHWCHVMERESFSDPAIARLMNDHFICVKVDREERPDVDALFMDACQAMTGRGGWPLNAFATPGGEPFWAGTYFPPVERSGMPSWPAILRAMAEGWRDDRRQVLAAADRMIERLQSQQPGLASGDSMPPADESVLTEAASAILAQADRVNGGFGGSPKFPQTEAIEFLLARGETEVTAQALLAMADGGIHDQIGGGFARYAIDAGWAIPHFEKMLSDNALLARAFLHAWQLTGERRLRDVCVSTLDWMLREMLSPEGAFWSSIDADDPLGEGRFYAWTPDQVSEALADAADAEAACAAFGISREGNWEDGLSVPTRSATVADLDRLRASLLAYRSGRPAPATDTKILSGWNSLAISALADAGSVLGEARYVDAARAAADYLLTRLGSDEGVLFRCLRGSEAIPGVLEDNALLLAALLDLYEATGESHWLEAAVRTADVTWENFGDHRDGGFFTTGSGSSILPVRRKDAEDRPIPSGNSAMALALVRLHALTGEGRHGERASGVIDLLGSTALKFPLGFGRLLLAIQLQVQGVDAVAIVGPDHAVFRAALSDSLRRTAVLAWASAPTEAVPLLAGKDPLEGTTAAWVCRDFGCMNPVTDPTELTDLLQTPANGGKSDARH